MLFYYSGTGNTQKLAQIIAERLNDSVIDIEKAIADEAYQYQLKDNEPLGFAIPVYFGNVPSIVQTFLSSLKIQTGDHYYAYLAMTDGGMSFKMSQKFTWMMFKQGLTINGIFELITYDSSGIAWKNEDINWDRLRADVDTRSRFIAEQIADRTKGSYYQKQPLAGLGTASMKLLYNAIKTSRFRVSQKCIACGLCAKRCPDHAIVIEDRHPKWIKDHCMLCLRCLHHCPEEAIDIFNSDGKTRYTKPI